MDSLPKNDESLQARNKHESDEDVQELQGYY